MRQRLWWFLVGGVVVIVVVAAAVLVVVFLGSKSPISPEVSEQVTSTLLLPTGSDVVIDRASVNYNKAEKLLIYKVAYERAEITVSEQPTPESFVDIPEVYKKLVDGMNNYPIFDVNVGTVYVTKPKELAGKQAAVLNAKGTLLFAKPTTNLTDGQWRVFFKNVDVQK